MKAYDARDAGESAEQHAQRSQLPGLALFAKVLQVVHRTRLLTPLLTVTAAIVHRPVSTPNTNLSSNDGYLLEMQVR